MTRSTQWLIVFVVAAFLMSLPAAPALADVVGSGISTTDIDGNNGAFTGTWQFDNVSHDVFGTPVNLGTAGTISTAGHITSFNPSTLTGTFSIRGVAPGCTLCDASCNSCDAACPLCYLQPGTFVCPPSGCASGLATAASSISKLVGTVVAGLPPGLAYSSDGNPTLTIIGSTFHFSGSSSLNAFQPATTMVGSNVEVSTNTTFMDNKTGTVTTLAVDVTFANVSHEGTTTVVEGSSAASLLPPDATADVGHCSKPKSLGCQSDANCPSGETCSAYHAFIFDVSTTASVTPPIKVCIHYPDNEKKPPGGNGFVDGTGKPGLPEKSLRLFHDEGDVFVDVTLSGYPDTFNNVVCGQVNSLSAFGMFVPTDMPGASNGPTDCVSEWSLCPSTAVGGTGNGGGVGAVPSSSHAATVPKPILSCSLSDPTCVGQTPGACTFCVRVCPNVKDPRIFCTPTDVAQYTLTKLLPGSSGVGGTNAANILTALQHLPGGDTNVNQVKYTPALSSGLQCTDPITLVVPLPSGKKSVTKAIGLKALTSTGAVDANKLSLVCNQ